LGLHLFDSVESAQNLTTQWLWVYNNERNERLTALVGKVTVEKEWLAKKLKSLGLSNCKPLVELKLSSPHVPSSLLSVNCNTPIFHTTLK
jgi:putative transposase